MKLIQLVFLSASISMFAGCAGQKFDTKSQSVESTDVSSMAEPSPRPQETQNQIQPQETDSGETAGNYLPSVPSIPSGSQNSNNNNSTSTTPANSCNAKFEEGYLCQAGTGIVLPDDGQAESICRNYCDSNKSACCALGRSNIAQGQGYVFCHASKYARTKYVNNYKELYPEAVDAGRKTSIAALNCSAAQAKTFTWGNHPTSCLQGYDFKQYGQVASNADVFNAMGGDVTKMRAHWYSHGNREGRDLYLASEALRKGFNPHGYLANQPDVLLAGVNPWSHYQSCGVFEKRPGS